MFINKKQLMQIIILFNFIYLIKSSSENVDKSLIEILNRIELKLESLINEKMLKLEENISKKLTKLINDNMSKLEDTIKHMNIKNQQMFKMDHLTITELNEKYEMINHKYKCSNITTPRSCNDLKGCDSNIYNLMLPEISSKPFPALCDLKTLDGGWTIIQRRQDGSENFYRNWTDYAEGFGNVNGEFFLGLNKIHALTTSGDPQELYIMLEDFEGVKKYARYGEFKVDTESNEFKITLNQYSGNAGDSFMKYHNNMKFSTRDRDNDKYSDYNCAEGWKGAWWYKDCYGSNLNGQYYTGEKIKTKGGVVWFTFTNDTKYSLKFTQMMVRPKEN